MPRKYLKHYAGATGRIDPSALSKLGPAFMVQPKMDGAYCHVHLDRLGCIARISSRTGRSYGGDNVTGLVGQFVGYPGAVLIGELTAHTEAGNADALEFGARRVHLFDMAFGMNCEPLAGLTYATRRAKLCEMQAAVATYGPGQSWYVSEHGLRDKATGWFTERSARGIALTPIVPQVRANACAELWDMVKAKKLEGLVAVSQGATIGARGAKRKCKLSNTLDAVVAGVDSRTVCCLWGANYFTVSRGKRDVCVADVVEVKHDGWYESGTTPRFPRIVRVRHDMAVL